MATYPGALPTIPDNGTFTHAQVAREIEAATTELGVNPSGAQTDVAARFTVVESRITAVEAATSLAGVEVAVAELTADFSLLTSPGTYADVTGLSIAVPAQTRAYELRFACELVIASSASYAVPKYTGAVFRIIDSTNTVTVKTTQVPTILPVAGAATLFAEANFYGRVPAGQAATTWKVQARASAGIDAQVTTLAIYAMGRPVTITTGVGRSPATFQAVTV